MPLTNLNEKQGCRIALWLVGGAVGLLLLLSVLPIHTHVHPHGLATRAKSDMHSLVASIQAYQTEYNRLPSPHALPLKEDNSTGYCTTSAEGKKIIEILMATDTGRNPRQIPFFEPPAFKQSGGGYTNASGLVDRWGTKGYIILLDYNGDGKIADPEHPATNIEAPAIAYSAGPDHDFSTWRDNVKSWD